MDSDLKEHFNQYQGLLKCTIEWDKLGRSKGEATIIFDNKDSANKAMKEFNGNYFIQVKI